MAACASAQLAVDSVMSGVKRKLKQQDQTLVPIAPPHKGLSERREVLPRPPFVAFAPFLQALCWTPEKQHSETRFHSFGERVNAGGVCARA